MKCKMISSVTAVKAALSQQITNYRLRLAYGTICVSKLIFNPKNVLPNLNITEEKNNRLF